MLQKLLKYDLKNLFKYWWILALTSLGLSVLGGFSLDVLVESEEIVDPYLYLGASLTVFVSIIAISAFIIGAEVFVIMRFYRNFFTDEGYLTFTLPVTRSQLLSSKLISATIINLATGVLAALEFMLLFGISHIGTDMIDFFEFLFPMPDMAEIAITPAVVIGFIVLILIVIAILIVSAVASTLLIYGCITISAVIAKKHKILAAIGIYYAFSLAWSFLYNIGLFVSDTGVFYFMVAQPPVMYTLTLFMLLLIILALLVALAIGLYTFVLHMLHKKLNLS